MSTIQRYLEIQRETYNCSITKFDCFAAFNKKQFNEGLASIRPLNEDEKLVHLGGGVYGTRDGVKKLLAFYEEQRKKVARDCDPQDVYDHLFADYECCYAFNGDENAIFDVVSIFGEEKARTVKRRCACVNI